MEQKWISVEEWNSMGNPPFLKYDPSLDCVLVKQLKKPPLGPEPASNTCLACGASSFKTYIVTHAVGCPNA